MVQIRAASPEDHDAVMKLWGDGGLGIVNDEQWRAITTGGCARLLVAEDGGTPVGAAIAAYDGWRAFVYHIAVAGQYRRQGVATALLSEAERDVKRRGAERIFVLVHESKTDGLALCTAAGYELEGDLALVKALPA
jgi:ribosomal protein S18 acetylase RimI-like enzyme